MSARNRTKAALALAVVAMAALVLAATSADAAIILYEGFDYAAGDIDGSQAGGIGFDTTGWTTSNHSNTNSYDVFSPGLSFPGVPTEGLSVARPSAPGSAEMNRPISAAPQAALTADGSTIWFSVLMRDRTFAGRYENAALVLGAGAFTNAGSKPVTMAGGEAFGVAFDGSNNPVTNSLDVHAIAIDDGATTLSTGFIEDPTSGENITYLIAGKIEWASAGNDDTLSLYDITDVSAALPAPFATMTADLDQSAFDTVAIGSQQIGIFDEIRFGNSYADVVVPEPGTMGLLALGGLALLRRRRA